MKKTVTMMLVLAMIFSLVACGTTQTEATLGETTSETESVQAVSLKVWAPSDELDITKERCEAFAEVHPEYDLTFEIVDVGIFESEGMLQNDPDLAADVFQLASGSISVLVESGLLLPISANLEEIKALYGEGALDSCSVYNAELDMDLMYAVPFSPNTWFMYYNKDLYTEEEVKSLDVMMAKDLGEGMYNFSCAFTNAWYIEAYFYAAGCTVFGENGDDPTFCDWNSENGLIAANYMLDLMANPKYLEDVDSIALAMMKDGKLGAMSSGTWSYPDLYAALGDSLGACALPTINLNGTDCQMRNFSDYKTWAVKSNTSYPLAAQQLAAWLANEDSQLLRYQVAGAAPCALPLIDQDDIVSNVAIVGILQQTQYTVPQPTIAKISDYWVPAGTLGYGIYGGTITKDNIQSELDKCVEQITGDILS